MEKTAEHAVFALERAALDRWGKGDPGGYLEITAPEVSYFDPFVERRVDGIAALSAPLRAPPRENSNRARRDPRPARAGHRRRGCPDISICQLRERGRHAMELHRSLPALRRRLENRPLALVIDTSPRGVLMGLNRNRGFGWPPRTRFELPSPGKPTAPWLSGNGRSLVYGVRTNTACSWS